MMRLSIVAIAVLGISGKFAVGQPFLNLSLPRHTDARFTAEPPFVLKATKSGVVVAQRGKASGKEDIQVIEVDGYRSKFVGENGRGITGSEGTTICEGAVSPDGRSWILVEHSRFPKELGGNQYCVYVLENDKWSVAGPGFGAPRENARHYTDDGLYFLGDNRPVAVAIHENVDAQNSKRSTWDYRLRRMEANRWVTLPGFEYRAVAANHVRVIWAGNRLYVLRHSDQAGRTTLDVCLIQGHGAEDVSGPFELDTWPESMHFFDFAVSPNGTIAVVSRVADEKKTFALPLLRLYHPSGRGAFRREDPPLRFGDLMGWSPTGFLHVVRTSGDRILVHRLEKDRWIPAAEGKEPDWDPFLSFIEDLQLFFRDDGTPIVTWEVGKQVD